MPTRPIWTLALNNPVTVPPAFDESRVFFSIGGDRLVAYDIESGKQLWLVDAAPLFQPATGGGLVFFADKDGLSALRAADGTVAWQLPLPAAPVMRPVWDNGWLIVLAADSALAFRASDGHLVWRRNLPAAAHAPAALAADRVYVSLADGRVTAMNVTDGSPAWDRKIGGQPNELLALDDRLYVGSTDNFFYCLLTKDGRIDWRWRTGADVVGAPVADDKRVYFVSYDNVVRALSQTSGGQQWMRALPFRPIGGPQLGGASLLVVGQSPTIRTYSVKDGAPGEEINAGDEIAAPPHILKQAVSDLPMVLYVTRSLLKGATAGLAVRSIEPTQILAVAPLPNVAMPAPMPATR